MFLFALIPFIVSHQSPVVYFGPEVGYYKKVNQPIFTTTTASVDPLTCALDFYKSTILPFNTFSEFVVKNAYMSERTEITHVYLRQIINGLEVSNGDFNVNVKNGRIISFGDSFYRGELPVIALKEANIHSYVDDISINKDGPWHALLLLTRHLNIQFDDISFNSVKLSLDKSRDSLVFSNLPFTVHSVPIRLNWLHTNDQIHLTWSISLQTRANWYNAQVHTSTNRILSLLDWVSSSSYHVFPFPQNSPVDGPRKTLLNPSNPIASPLGWHTTNSTTNYTHTQGNNVYAQENLDGTYSWQQKYRPNAGPSLRFHFPLSLHRHPHSYLNSSITQLFYTTNILHDLFYIYGFNEISGNFQENNFDFGGIGGDALVANAQDGSGYNNANFATPPDGIQPMMRMYIWNDNKPFRDGDLESGIVVHEYGHGVTTRLTGGASNSNCLGWGEAGGMGEGWSDFFATILRVEVGMERNVALGIGEYANWGKGIRRFPYTTDMNVNPHTYADVDNYWSVHAKGEVWTVLLWGVFWELVERLGFTDDWYSASLSFGNTLALLIVVEALRLQPCRPHFVDGRDAIIEAEFALTGGKYTCEVWRGFAKRGMGVAATKGGLDGKRVESFKVPRECKGRKAANNKAEVVMGGEL